MRRRPALATMLAAAAVLALDAQRASAEPYDLDLAGLGAPDPAVWEAAPFSQPPATAAILARESKQRFATLSSEVALALSSTILHPASTIGHSQFDFDLEMGVAGVHPGPVGSQTGPGLDDLTPWPTRSRKPFDLYMPSFHVRKALPFSFELGGRMTYLSMSSYYAVQGEAKWALNEGFELIPDLAVRLAHTQLLGQKDWSLGATDVDFMVSKRWGVMGVTSFTPYLALRFTFMSASSKRIQFDSTNAGTPTSTSPSATPANVVDTSAAFPNLRAGFYRTTFGLRFTSYSASLAVEMTYFGGKHYTGKEGLDEYPDFGLASSVAGAFKLGWEF